MNQSLTYELNQVMPLAEATGLLSSLCTIQQRPLTSGQPKVSAAGQVDLNPPEFTDVAGLVNIPCQLVVMAVPRPDQSGIARMPTGFDDKNARHLLLNDYYPQILDSYQAVVDGTPYQIQTVEHDSQKQQTRLAIRTYTK